jgi:hypothetical protein
MCAFLLTLQRCNGAAWVSFRAARTLSRSFFLFSSSLCSSFYICFFLKKKNNQMQEARRVAHTSRCSFLFFFRCCLLFCFLFSLLLPTRNRKAPTHLFRDYQLLHLLKRNLYTSVKSTRAHKQRRTLTSSPSKVTVRSGS